MESLLEKDFFSTMFLTFKLAFITTVVLLFIGIPIAYFLTYYKLRFKPVLETVVSMPLVLPPTVLGFYFLVIFAPDSFLGNFLENLFGLRFVFTFEGLVLASVIYSLPFMVHPVQSGFNSIPYSLIEASYTLGKSKLETFFRVILPNVKPSILTGIVLSFAHTIGEFGVVLMVGGSIPGETKVASIAIYEEVEALNYEKANLYALVLFAITFLILVVVYSINKKLLRAERL